MTFISNLRGKLGGIWGRVVRLAQRDKPPVCAFETLRQGPAPKRESWRDRWFPHRQILIRGPNQTAAIHFGQRFQIAVVFIAAFSALGFLGVSISAAWNRHEASRMAREMDALRTTAHLEAEHAAQDRDLLSRISRELTERMAERDRAASDPATNGKTVAERQADIDRLIAVREATIDRAFEERKRVAAERDQAIAERDAALAANRDTVARLDAQMHDTISEVEKIIASTGLDPNRLAPLKPQIKDDKSAPRGGPFLPWLGLKPDADLGQDVGIEHAQIVVTGLDRLQRLRDVLKHLPVASPVGEVELSSGFGYRVDPFTGQASQHDGADFRGPRGTAIYATAAGVVATAGYMPEYGNTVDIDHGFGLMTRYAHLDKILVKPGEAVVLHQKLGLMGATGRATGVHLHYETRVNGNARNPLNFLKVDHYVPEKIPAASLQSDGVSHDRD